MPSLDTLIIIAFNLIMVICVYFIVKRGSKLPAKPLSMRGMIQTLIDKPSSVHSPSKRLATKRAINSLTQ